ncbi:MAG: co-chaperone DjlA [Gammaproteobacteria bacterium]
MAWWGKVIGGAAGFLMGGPLGAALGAAVGHQVDKGMDPDHYADGPHGDVERREQAQAAFFTAAFSVMGRVAKADGRVSPDEIRAAEAVMDHMRLTDDQRRAAVNLFREGKSAHFDLDAVLADFRRNCHRRLDLMRMFLEIQLHAAYADGRVAVEERQILDHIARVLGLAPGEMERLEALIRAHYAAGAGRAGAGDSGGTRTRSRGGPSLDEAYALLGVERESDDQTVKRAYRRLMSQHHPDKLVAKGMPEEMVRIATEKSQAIRAAYDRIRDARGTAA